MPIFVEVGVDPDFGLLRLRRAVGVYSAGRIINSRTARSQMTGGIIWGWGKATMEESDQEPVHGRWLAKNLSNVAVPVNADIPADLDVSFVDEYDEAASLIGVARDRRARGDRRRRRGGGGGARRRRRARAGPADPAVEGARPAAAVAGQGSRRERRVCRKVRSVSLVARAIASS